MTVSHSNLASDKSTIFIEKRQTVKPDLRRTFKHGLNELRVKWTSVDVFNLPPSVVNGRRNVCHTHTGETYRQT